MSDIDTRPFPSATPATTSCYCGLTIVLTLPASLRLACFCRVFLSFQLRILCVLWSSEHSEGLWNVCLAWGVGILDVVLSSFLGVLGYILPHGGALIFWGFFSVCLFSFPSVLFPLRQPHLGTSPHIGNLHCTCFGLIYSFFGLGVLCCSNSVIRDCIGQGAYHLGRR